MKLVCPHCSKDLNIEPTKGQKVGGCCHCNGKFNIELVDQATFDSICKPNNDELKVLCPLCNRKLLMNP